MQQTSFLPEQQPPIVIAAPPKPKAASSPLWSDGLAILCGLTGLAPVIARRRLGRLLDECQGDRDALLAMLRDAERKQPDQPMPWLVAGALAIAAKGVAADEWGADAWLATVAPNDPAAPTCTQIWDWAVPNAAATVRDLCEAAGLPPSWRGDKTWIAEICADRFEINNVIDVLRELSNASPQAVTSLRYWDSAIRQRCLRWDPERCDWWAPERKQRAAA